MDEVLADLPLRELLRRLAQATPAPGGGSASAVTCALAAGLIEMAAGFGGDELAGAGRRAGELRTRALELAELELSAYEPVLAALRAPADDPGRGERLVAARSEASRSPLAIALVGAELAELAVQAQRDGSRHLEGDATAAALLAEGACRAAARLVEINLKDAGDQGPVRRAAALAGEAAAARGRSLAEDPAADNG